MVIWHISPTVDCYLKYIKHIQHKLPFNLSIFKYLSVFFLLISIGLTITDIGLTKTDTHLKKKKIDFLTWLCLILFFDLMKLYYIFINTYLFTLLMAIPSVVFMSFIITKFYQIKKEEREVKSTTEYSLGFLLLSLLFSTIYHYPTFAYILKEKHI